MCPTLLSKCICNSRRFARAVRLTEFVFDVGCRILMTKINWPKIVKLTDRGTKQESLTRYASLQCCHQNLQNDKVSDTATMQMVVFHLEIHEPHVE